MKGAHWYGPIVHEKISGLKLVGMASLRPFFQGINLEEVIVRLFLAFDHHHSQHLESSMTEESVRSTLTNSNSIFETHDFSMLDTGGNFPTPHLIAGILRFLRLIVLQDNNTEEKYQSLVKLETSTFPLTLKLLTNYNLRIEDQCLLHTLTDFIMICVVNYSWAAPMLLEEDKCVCLSMLVTAYHRLLISPDKLLELFALLLTSSQEVDSKPSISNEMSRLVDKYRIALLEMESRCAADGSGTNFCTALSRFLVHTNAGNQGLPRIDLWDPKVVQILSKSLIGSRNKRAALKHLMIISHLTQEAVMEEQSLVKETVQMLEKPKLTNESLSFLNNFCYSNPGAQIFLVQDLAIHRKLVPVAVKLCSQLLIDVKRSLMVTITNLLSFLTTLTADCPAAKASLPFNVWVDKGKSSSLMQVLVDLLSNDNLGDNLIRSKVWIPYSFRIITASLTSVECRSWLIRTPKFLNRQCSRDIDVTTPVSEVLWLDLLLSLTTYSDGQMWLAKSNELVDQLVDKAHDNLPALAILRNLSFHPSGRAKLLLLPNYLGLLPSCLQKEDEVRARLALTSIWALAANCHKAKVVLNKSLMDLEFHVPTNVKSLSAKVLNVLSIE